MDDTFLLGKYGNIGFLLSEEEIDIDYDFLKKVKLEITELDEIFF